MPRALISHFRDRPERAAFYTNMPFIGGLERDQIMKAKVLTPPHPIKSNELLAVSYIRDAEDYADAAEQLAYFRNNNPRYFLFCHAIELALKAYILAAGGDRKELRAIKHDLQKAYDRATALGYRPADMRVPDIIGTLEPFHKDYSFRYIAKTGLQILPNPNELADVLKSILKQIKPVTRAAYSNNKAKLTGDPKSHC